MRQAIFFDGQDVLQEDLQEIDDSKSDELRRRLTDISFQVGIIDGLEATYSFAFNLQVAPGTAYDSNGEAILVLANEFVGVSALDIGNYLVVRYLAVEEEPVEHPITGVLNDTRRTDFYEFLTIAIPAATDVILCLITDVTGGGVVTLDQSVRVYWSAKIADGVITDAMLDPTGDVITHINARGTGVFHVDTNPHAMSPADIGFVSDTTPQTHQLNNHANGIEPASNNSVGLVTVNSATAPDQLALVQIVSGDSLLINGQRIQAPTEFDPAVLTFVAAGANPALYEVYCDELAAVATSIRAAYSAAKNVTGVQVVDVSPNHDATLTNLAWTFAGGTLRWDSGPTVVVGSTDRFITLRRSVLGDQYIVVWVDVSALPGSNQADAIQINSTAESDGFLLLANVPWSGSATGFLGYGDQGASGAAYDKRLRGNLASADLRDDTKDELIYQYFKETRADGMVYGGTCTDSGGLNLLVAHGVAYVDGKRYSWDDTTLLLDDNATSYIYVDADGVVQASLVQPVTFGFDANQSGPSGDVNATRVASISTAVTAAGAITLITAKTVFLSQVADVARSTYPDTSITLNAFVGEWVYGANPVFTGASLGATLETMIGDLSTQTLGESGASRIAVPDFGAGYGIDTDTIEGALQQLQRHASEPSYFFLPGAHFIVLANPAAVDWQFNGDYWTSVSDTTELLRIWLPTPPWAVTGSNDCFFLNYRVYIRGDLTDTITVSLKSYDVTTGVISAALDSDTSVAGNTAQNLDITAREDPFNGTTQYILELEPDALGTFRVFGARIGFSVTPLDS